MTERRSLSRLASLVAGASTADELRAGFDRRLSGSGQNEAARLLLLGLWARFADGSALAELRRRASSGGASVAPPVVILAGGTDRNVEARLQAYRELLVEAFAGLVATVISGGTVAGVAGLAGDLGAANPRLRTIGYLPAVVPPDVAVDRDPGRYRELRTTGGGDFSPLESLQAWTDVAASGLDVTDVRLLGINGGQIAATEYRVALALGAPVGILAGSGREADSLLADPGWSAAPTLVTLRPDAAELGRFLGG